MCNLDWSSKKFRGKAIKTKKGATKLLEDLEKFYQIKKEEFVTNMEEDEYEDEDYTIISLEFMKQSRPVHMPGYPESVPKSDSYSTCVCPDLCTS